MDGETVSHVVQCPAPSAHKLWTTALNKLRTWIIENEGGEDFAQIVYENLLAWQSFQPFPFTIPDNPILHRAIKQQDKIGWRSFLDGFLVKEWRQYLTEHFLARGSRKSSLLWMSRLQRGLWDVSFAMWMHRNEVLHHDGARTHQFEEQELDQSILSEWSRGIATLPSRFNYLFRGTLRQRLKDKHQYKKMWLTSVWSARESTGDLFGVITRNRTISQFFEQWQACKGPRTNLTNI
jgi:hypothetical protein